MRIPFCLRSKRPSMPTKPTAPPQPQWVVFRCWVGDIRQPFIAGGETPDAGWQYVLDVASEGYLAHREGDAIVFAGRTPNLVARVS